MVGVFGVARSPAGFGTRTSNRFKRVCSLGFLTVWTGVQTSTSHSGEGVGWSVLAPGGVHGRCCGVPCSCSAGDGCGSSCSPSGAHSSHPAMGSSSSSSSSGSSCRLWCAEICPKSRADPLRRTSARWSSLEFPGMSLCDGVCSHLTCSPNHSTSHRMRSQRSLCWTGPLTLVHLWRLHCCAHPQQPKGNLCRSGNAPLVGDFRGPIVTLAAPPECLFVPHQLGCTPQYLCHPPKILQNHPLCPLVGVVQMIHQGTHPRAWYTLITRACSALSDLA